MALPQTTPTSKACLLRAVSEVSMTPLDLMAPKWSATSAFAVKMFNFEGNHSHSLMVARACMVVDRPSRPLRPTQILRTQPLLS